MAPAKKGQPVPEAANHSPAGDDHRPQNLLRDLIKTIREALPPRVNHLAAKRIFLQTKDPGVLPVKENRLADRLKKRIRILSSHHHRKVLEDAFLKAKGQIGIRALINLLKGRVVLKNRPEKVSVKKAVSRDRRRDLVGMPALQVREGLVKNHFPVMPIRQGRGVALLKDRLKNHLTRAGSLQRIPEAKAGFRKEETRARKEGVILLASHLKNLIKLNPIAKEAGFPTPVLPGSGRGEEGWEKNLQLLRKVTR